MNAEAPTVESVEDRADQGFTLIELVITVAIVGTIMVALTGVVLEYLKTETATAARYTESNSVQLAAAYWQRDVSSTGLRSATFDATDKTFKLQKSVDYPYTGSLTGAGCTIPGTGVIALVWGQYESGSSNDIVVRNTPTPIAVTYSVQDRGSGADRRYDLVRTRCTKSSGGWVVDSSQVITRNLTTASRPVVACSTTCDAASPPSTISMTIESSDPDNNDGSIYKVTLTGERRQT
ncbi:prepilin-type N-terminal cleavage/methylation domain-containing protein [Nocardioides sp. QY071]|nr:prepilin-type N-terminal cleavage/methylation domain-containing protein [Nocardioides sp. QY071]WGY04811.1 prepilin-type N-terminal cleavage/methylation domain-containing protein [Nocardioides sp. QY071]